METAEEHENRHATGGRSFDDGRGSPAGDGGGGGAGEPSVEALQNSIKKLVNQRNELRDKLRQAATSAIGGGGVGGRKDINPGESHHYRSTGGSGQLPDGGGGGQRSPRLSGGAASPRQQMPGGGGLGGQKRGREVIGGGQSQQGTGSGHERAGGGGANAVDSAGAIASAAEAVAAGEQPTLPQGVRVPFGLRLEDLRVEKRPKLEQDGKAVKRSRNLFGSLVGHLKKAKVTLDKEQETKTSELQKKLAERVDMKLKLERRNLAELRRRDLREEKTKNVNAMRQVQREIIAKDIELLRVKLENHYRRMSQFIRTRADPPLFWLPKVHTPKTEILQSETRDQIELKVSSLRAQFGSEYIAEVMASVPGGGTMSPVATPGRGEQLREDEEVSAVVAGGVEETTPTDDSRGITGTTGGGGGGDEKDIIEEAEDMPHDHGEVSSGGHHRRGSEDGGDREMKDDEKDVAGGRLVVEVKERSTRNVTLNDDGEEDGDDTDNVDDAKGKSGGGTRRVVTRNLDDDEDDDENDDESDKERKGKTLSSAAARDGERRGEQKADAKESDEMVKDDGDGGGDGKLSDAKKAEGEQKMEREEEAGRPTGRAGLRARKPSAAATSKERAGRQRG